MQDDFVFFCVFTQKKAYEKYQCDWSADVCSSDLIGVKTPNTETDEHKEDNNYQNNFSRAMVFDSSYDDHKGIIASVRVFDGELKEEDYVSFIAVDNKTVIKEVGVFTPLLKRTGHLSVGEIGYIVTGVKDTKKIKIGDTIISSSKTKAHTNQGNNINIKELALKGYEEPKPVVFVSFFPSNESEFDELKKALERLQLNDSSFIFEPDYNEVLGRGFKGGFLGKLDRKSVV